MNKLSDKNIIKGKRYDGEELVNLIELANSDKIISDELTRGRIRTIFVRAKYGMDSISTLAEYYDLPKEFIRDMVKGKIFADITAGS